MQSFPGVSPGNRGATTVPDVPTNLTPVGGNTSVTLTWDAASQATIDTIVYRVYRDKRPLLDGTGAPIEISTSTYTDSGLSNGKLYLYSVNAVNITDSNSPNPPIRQSEIVIVVPICPVAPPTVTGSVSNGAITLTIINGVELTNTSVSQSYYITSYNIYKNDVFLTNTKNAQYTVESSDVTLGVSNIFKVETVISAPNSQFTSGKSPSVGPYTLYGPPAVPYIGTRADSETSIIYIYIQPLELTDLGGDIDTNISYTVTRTDTGNPVPVIVIDNAVSNGSSSPITVEDNNPNNPIVAGVVYTYSVYSKNSASQSSPATSTARLLGIPVTPTVSISTSPSTANSSATITLDITMSITIDGAETYDYYVYDGSTSAGPEPLKTILGAIPNQTTRATISINAGQYYSIVVAVSNGSSSGPVYTTPELIIVGGVPNAPVISASVIPGASPSVNISITDPTFTDNQTITYTILRNTGPTYASTTLVSIPLPIPYSGFVMDDTIDLNKSYKYTVIASNSSGMGAAATATVIPAGQPTAPAITAVGGVGNATITIDPQSSDLGLTYNIYENGGNSPINATPIVANVYIDTNVVNGTAVTYNATVVNSNGLEGPASNSVTVTPLSSPQIILIANPDTTTAGKVILNVNVTDCGNGRPTGVPLSYIFTRNDGSNTVVTPTKNGDNYTLLNQPVGNSLTYTLVVTNPNNLSSSFLSTAVTPSSTSTVPPTQPSSFTVTATVVGLPAKTVQLTLTPPADSGDGTPLQNLVYKFTDYNDNTVLPSQNGNIWTLTNVPVSTLGVYYTVRATNTSTLYRQAISNNVLPMTAPSAFSVNAVAGIILNQVTLTITPPADSGNGSGGLPIVYSFGGAQVNATADPLVWTVNNLIAGTSYSYTVTASNANLLTNAATSNSVIPLIAPAAPSMTIQASETQVVLTIIPVTPMDNIATGGDTGVTYTIFRNDSTSPLMTDITSLTYTDIMENGYNGYDYSYTVIAGNTLFRSIASSPVTEATAPDAPGVVLTASDNSVLITITPSVVVSAGTVRYTITRSVANDLSTTVGISDDSSALRYIDDSVVNGTTYNYSVLAVNNFYTSTFATNLSVTPLSAPVLGSLVAVADIAISQRVTLTVTVTDCGNGTPTGPALIYVFKRGTTVVTASPSANGVWLLDDEPVNNSVSYTVTATNLNGASATATSNAVTPRIYATVNGNTGTVAVVDPTLVDLGTITKGTPVAINSGTVEEPVYVTAITANIAGEVYNSVAANALLVEAMETAIESGISSMLVKRIFPGDTTATNSLIELGTPAAPLTSETAGGTKSTTLDLPTATYTDGSPLPADKTVVACDITPRTDGQAGSYILIKVQVDGVALIDGFSIPITIKDNSAPGLTGYPLYHFVNSAWKLLVTLPPDLTDPTGCTYTGILTENQDYTGGAPPANAPGAPAKPTTVAQVGAITVNYSAPASVSPITNYRIYWFANSDAIKGNAYVGSTATSFSVTNLLANTSYTFVVAAINGVVEGPNSLRSDPIQTSPPGPICFMANAPVLTPRGYRRIDSLKAGDLVKLADGCSMEIKKVKVVRYQPSAAVNPFVIPKGTFGAKERLLISPSHRVAVPGRGMVKACNLGLKQWTMHEAFDYYNLELEKWENMVVAGVEVESLAPVLRTTITTAQFKQLLRAKYGAHASDPELLSKIPASCWSLGNGLVSIPYIKQ